MLKIVPLSDVMRPSMFFHFFLSLYITVLKISHPVAPGILPISFQSNIAWLASHFPQRSVSMLSGAGIL
jgi:hypothetical protein